jgi:hypothetical protein
MLIILSHRTAICQPVAEVQLTGVVLLGAVTHSINFKLISKILFYIMCYDFLYSYKLNVHFVDYYVLFSPQIPNWLFW